MIKRFNLLVLPLLLLCGGAAGAQPGQYPMMDKVVQKVLQKYQTSSCQQLASEKSQPPSGKKAQIMDRAVQLLQNDPQMRAEFINRVAAPIANKLFECGMIP
jgi:hypothetical protein